MIPYFLRQIHLATASRLLAQSSAAGLIVDAPTADKANLGALGLRASGVPLSATSMSVALTTGGLPTGYATPTQGQPGAAVRWLPSGETRWRGFTDTLYVTYCKQIAVGSAVTKYVNPSKPRALANGSFGFLVSKTSISNSLQFITKSARTGTSTFSQVTTDNDTTYRASFVVLPSGRLLAYWRSLSASAVYASYSDDHGATWASFSQSTGIAFNTSLAIYAEYARDMICVVTGGSPSSVAGTVNVYWSVDGGSSFALTTSAAAIDAVDTTVTTGGQVLVIGNENASGTVRVWRLEPGGDLNITDYKEPGLSVNTGAPLLAIAILDDGAIWAASSANSRTETVTSRVSRDGGQSWNTPGGSVLSLDVLFGNYTVTTEGAARGFDEMVLGAWKGSLIMVGVTNSVTAATDGGLQEVWFGGWEDVTETLTKVGATGLGVTGNYSYEGLYTAFDEPDNVGFTRTDVAAGATTTLTASGFRIVGTAANNSYYVAPATFFNPGSGHAGRFLFACRVDSDGSVADNRSSLKIAYIDGGANQQFIRMHFSTTQARLTDTTGTLVTASIDLTVMTEWKIAFAHDYQAGAAFGGGGTVSIWYRREGVETWTVFASNQVVGEVAGPLTTLLQFGGDAAGAVDWTIIMLGYARGSQGLESGFTNPTNLHGRSLSSSIDVYAYNGIHLGAFGAPGVAGDLYTSKSTYSYDMTNIWRNSRPSSVWKSSAAGGIESVRFGDGADYFRYDMAALFGTNMQKALIQFDNDSAFGSVDQTITLDATIWAGASDGGGLGYVRVDGEPFIPHAFRSRRGRRFFLTDGTTVWEIDNNESDTIHVEALPVIASPTPLWIFGDRMAGTMPSFTGSGRQNLYARIYIAAQPAGDDGYTVGAFFLGRRHDVTTIYDNGFVDESIANVRISKSEDGYQSGARMGPSSREIRIAWSPVDRLNDDTLDRMVSLLEALEGAREPVAFCRNPDDVRTLGIYAVRGNAARENVYGELVDAYDRLAQIVLVEFF